MFLTGNDSANTLTGGARADVIYGFNPNGPQRNVDSIAATRVAAGLTQPLFAVSPPDDLHRLFIVEKTGRIKILDLDTLQVQSTPFLDLSGQIDTDGEQGLLGLAFDPDYAENGYFYVNLISRETGDTEVRRYQVSASNPDRANAASGTPVITIDQPAGLTNHKGGWIGFGPDGYLYVATGDGGGGGDPHNTAQNMTSLLGKMLRIDVSGDDFPGSASRNYAIPDDNPFADSAGRDEIWALGLRNPWRPGFDRVTGQLYIADVGQNEWEEIDLGGRGRNYGWDLREGPASHPGGSTPAPVSFTGPIYSYHHDVGRSITGGYVYRGPGEGLHGQYFFADFTSGRIFTLRLNGGEWVATDRTEQIHPNTGTIGSPSSFGEDGSGNLYIVDIGGEVFRLTPVAVSADHADVLNGGGGNDILFGGSGADTLNGGSGRDEMQGGPGSDMFIVDNPGDLAIEAPNAGTDTVSSSVSLTLARNVEKLVLTGDADIDGAGNRSANSITGNAGDNNLKGGNGADRLDGRAGNDVLKGGSGNDSLKGDAGHDTLNGNPGVDTLDGGPGNDTMNGGAGNDTYFVDAAGDLVKESGGSGTDTVQSAVSYTLPADIENLTLTGSAVNGTGNSRANTIAGNAGDNVLDGKDGADIIQGGGGNDTLVWSAADTRLDGGGGNDRLELTGAGAHLNLVKLPAGRVRSVERIDLTGSGGNTLTLDAQEVLAISSNDTLRVLGDTGDVLHRGGGAWVQGTDREIGGNLYHKYTQGLATLLVDTDVTVVV